VRWPRRRRFPSPDRQIGAQPKASSWDTCLFFHAPQSVVWLFLAVPFTVQLRSEAQIGRLPTEGEAFGAMLGHAINV
jgi:hypothetical protein